MKDGRIAMAIGAICITLFIMMAVFIGVATRVQNPWSGGAGFERSGVETRSGILLKKFKMEPKHIAKGELWGKLPKISKNFENFSKFPLHRSAPTFLAETAPSLRGSLRFLGENRSDKSSADFEPSS